VLSDFSMTGLSVISHTTRIHRKSLTPAAFCPVGRSEGYNLPSFKWTEEEGEAMNERDVIKENRDSDHKGSE